MDAFKALLDRDQITYSEKVFESADGIGEQPFVSYHGETEVVVLEHQYIPDHWNIKFASFPVSFYHLAQTFLQGDGRNKAMA